MKAVRKYTYLGYGVRGGGCEVAVTARTRCGWVELRECGKLLLSKRFPLKPKGTINKSYVMPANLHGSEAWCKKKQKKHCAKNRGPGESNMCTAQHRKNNKEHIVNVGFQ